MIRRFGLLAALLLMTAVALALRVPSLGIRPMHGDEAVHAIKFRDLWEKGDYQYDSNEFHGPTIYYAALPAVWLHGRHSFAATTEADFRLPIAIAGAALILLLAPLADGIGRRAAVWASILFCVSPAFVFYSRYFIQEMFLALFTLGALAFGWRYVRTRRAGWMLGVGLCAGLMIASKETAVLSFVAVATAVGMTAVWSQRADGRKLDLRGLWNDRLALATLALALGTAWLFLSGFGRHPAAAFGYLRSYTPWIHRAGGTALHRHEWSYYLRILTGLEPAGFHYMHKAICTETLIVVLAVFGMIVSLLPVRRVEESRSAARFFTFFTLVLTVIYSTIPYKTPWCVLSFLAGMIVLAGIGAASLIRLLPRRPLKAVAGAALLAACLHLGRQAYRASYVDVADAGNPYAYAQPVPDVVELQHKLEGITRAWHEHDATMIYVISVDNYYWPLPWYLRRYPNVGYWTQMPADPSAPIVLASPEFDDALTKKLDPTHVMTGYRGLRPGVFFETWVRMDVQTAYVALKKKEHPEGD